MTFENHVLVFYMSDALHAQVPFVRMIVHHSKFWAWVFKATQNFILLELKKLSSNLKFDYSEHNLNPPAKRLAKKHFFKFKTFSQKPCSTSFRNTVYISLKHNRVFIFGQKIILFQTRCATCVYDILLVTGPFWIAHFNASLKYW